MNPLTPRTIRSLLASILLYALAWMPLSPVLVNIAHADDELLPDGTASQQVVSDTYSACPAQSSIDDTSASTDPSVNTDPQLSADDQALADDEDSDEAVSPYQEVSEDDLRSMQPALPFIEERVADLKEVGTYDPDTTSYKVCRTNGDLDNLLSYIPISSDVSQVFDAVNLDSSRITWKNQLDKYALEGEPCTKFKEDKTCDETLGPDGKPLYFTDIFTSGNSLNHWDAPKADQRIAKTLLYLVTPAEQGGAGHEHIQVCKVIQDTKTNSQFTSSDNTDTSENVAANADSVSAQYYDSSDPEHPSKISQGVDICEIDNIRVTTQITQKHRLGGNSTSYQYSSFPIKVGWQSDQGIAQAPLPPMTDLYSASQQATAGTLAGFLNGMDLEATIDPATVDVNNMSDLVKVFGDSILTSLLEGGSLKGWDLTSTLNTFGRSYLASQLGLPQGSLSEGDTGDEIAENIGRTTAETNLGLPSGSLKGDTSQDIYKNVAQRYFEDSVFKISAGSLTPSSNSPINNQDDLLKRIGEGKIEKAFSLAPQSARTSDFSAFKKLNFITKLDFTDANASSADDALNLTYTQSVLTDKHNLKAADFDNLTSRLLKGQISFDQYKLLVGIRAFDTTLGGFSASLSDSNQPTSTIQQSCSGVTNSNGTDGHPDESTCLSARLGSSSIPYFLQGLGIDFNALAKKPSTPPASDIISQAMSSGQANQLISSKAYTNSGLLNQVTQAVNAVYGLVGSTQNTNPSLSDDAKAAKDHFNTIATNWKPSIQSAIAAVTPATQVETTTDDQLNDPTSLSASVFLNNTLGYINNDLNADLNNEKTLDQSGWSAALDLPGTLFSITPDGTQNDTPVISQDPLTTLMNGDLSILPVIGKIELAKHFTTDTTTQYSFASQLTTNLAPTITTGNTGVTLLNNLTTSLNLKGVSVAALTGNGVESDDFARIFQENLSKDTFKRIGDEILLGTAWNKSDIAGQINNLTNSSSVQKAASTIATDVQTVDFYTSRYKQLQKIAQDLSDNTAIKTENDSIQKELKTIASKKNVTLYQSIKSESDNLNVVLNSIQSKAPDIQQEVAQGKHLIEEIIAGHSLDMTQTADNNSTTPQNSSTCWSKDTIRKSLLSSVGKFTDTATAVASCQIDIGLNLPTGSMNDWYKTGKMDDYSFDSFETSIGRADIGISTHPSDKDAKARGEAVLESRGVSALLNKIPGVSELAGKAGINGQTIFKLLQGDSSALEDIGGQLMDNKMHWPSGTAKNVANPTCSNPDGTARACTDQERENIRLKSMANVGFQELGLNLNFPAGFDMTSGSIVTNYGRADLSNDLGLAANTFEGSFAQTRQKNTPYIIANGLGLGETVFDQKMLSIYQQLLAINSTLSKSLSNTAILNAYNGTNALVDQVTNADSNFYKTTPQATQDYANSLGTSYATQLTNLKNWANGNTAILGVLQPYLDELNQASSNSAYWGATYSGQLGAQIANFQQKVASLDQTYGFAKQKVSFKDYLTGKIDASVLNNIVGTNGVTSKVSDDAITALANTNPGLAEVLSGFKTLTGESLGQFMVGGGSKDIGSTLDINTLLTDQSAQGQQKRGYLFDTLLAKTFGTTLESKVDLDPGTFRNIALNPRQAPQILFSQGIEKIADQIFKYSSKGGDDQDKYKAEAVGDLKAAFLAGFVNSTTGKFEYSPNEKRVTTSLKKSLDTLEQDELNGYSQRQLGGVAITVGDINGIAAGNMNGVVSVGAQEFALATNKELLSSSNNDPRANAFLLNINDVVKAFDPTPYTQQQAQTIYTTSGIQYVKNDVKSLNSNGTCKAGTDSVGLCALTGKIDTMSDQQIMDYVNNNTGDDYADMIDYQANQAAINYPKVQQQQAQKNLQYQMYDIAAFQINPNIPRGFASAMLDGNSASKANVLGGFAFNALKFNDSSLGQFISAADFGGLTQFANSGFKDTSGISQQSIDGLSNWAADQFSKTFGISDLPKGAMEGFIGWASTGFDSSQLTSAKITEGPFSTGTKKFNIVPVGTVLKNWGQEKLFAWSDKVLGFNAGGTYQIYQSAQAYLKAAQSLAFAQSELATASALSTVATATGDSGLQAASGALSSKGASDLSKSKTASVGAEAALISTVINVAFSKQIGAAETQLGLVPGTGSIAVEMLVNLLLGGPVSPVSWALFIGMNLFGVYKVEVKTLATADGYYPFKGSFGSTGYADSNNASTYQVPSNLSYTLGEFNPKDGTKYHQGVEKAAQAKVQSVLSDLLLMPEKWGAATGENPQDLYVHQVFTDRSQDLEKLDYLISQPSPYDTPSGWGYGSLSERTIGFKADANNKLFGIPSARLDGFFPDPLFWNQIYIRF